MDDGHVGLDVPEALERRRGDEPRSRRAIRARADDHQTVAAGVAVEERLERRPGDPGLDATRKRLDQVGEGATVLSLFGNAFGGDEDRTPTATTTPVGLGVGLLGEAATDAIVRDAYVDVDDDWTFVLAVAVENRADLPVRIEPGAVTTGDGATVEGGGETPRLDTGETETFAGQWDLSSGSTPRVVSVTLVRYTEDGTATVTEQVRLRKVPVRGS